MSDDTIEKAIRDVKEAEEKGAFSQLMADHVRMEALLRDPMSVLGQMGVHYDALEEAAKREAQPVAVHSEPKPVPAEPGTRPAARPDAIHGEEEPKARIDTHWWGLQCVFNHEAAQLTWKIDAGVGSVAAAVALAAMNVAPPVGPLVSASATVIAGAATLHALAIKNLDKGNGVYFVWPWPALSVIYAPPATPFVLAALMIPYTN